MRGQQKESNPAQCLATGHDGSAKSQEVPCNTLPGAHVLPWSRHKRERRLMIPAAIASPKGDVCHSISSFLGVPAHGA